ncbi:MAG TPA: tRNA pseudouridine(55) synthase TruB [Bacilli bacterium]|nr:tRNA pseudouridine(55) synthase TruB [Bacilli bacterium]
MNGILIVNKPKQMTSHDVVNIVRKSVGTKKVGHTGTLDPDATGVLVIAINDATKVIPFLEEVDKTYLCEVTIGYATDTEDASGAITSMLPVERMSLEQVDEALTTLVGSMEQVPPMYSAVKVDGKKLYEYARNNIEVERAARTITIFEISRTSEIELRDQLATFSFRVRASKGTYIRTLCVEIGKRLGYPAHMKSLIREKSGIFSIEDAVTMEDIKEKHITIIPIEQSLSHLPQVVVSDEIMLKVLNGMKISLTNVDPVRDNQVVLLNKQGKLLAIYQKEENVYKAVRVWK